jgi:hypothetical protein
MDDLGLGTGLPGVQEDPESDPELEATLRYGTKAVAVSSNKPLTCARAHVCVKGRFPPAQPLPTRERARTPVGLSHPCPAPLPPCRRAQVEVPR